MLDGHLFASGQQQSFDHHNSSSNVRLVIYISCLLSAALLAIYLAAIVYNQAHARRLLGAIPVHQPPPLLVTSNLNVLRAGPAFNGNPASATAAGSDNSPTYSSSIDYSAALNAATTVMASNNKKQSTTFNSSNEHNNNETAFDLMNMNINGNGNDDRLLSKNNNLVNQSLFQQQWSNRFNIPIHVLVQLLTLQLLLVLLVESQNYLQRNRSSSTASYLLTTLLTNESAPITNVQQQSMLNSIGTITWLVVLILYYLIASVFFWLIGHLLKLNINLINLGKVILASSSKNKNTSDNGDCDRKLFGISPSNGSGGSTTTTDNNNNKYNSGATITTASIYNGPTTTATTTTTTITRAANQHQSAGNFYGAPGTNQCGYNGTALVQSTAALPGQQFNASTSPSSSTFSSQSIADLAAYNNHHLHHFSKSNIKKGHANTSLFSYILSTITNPIKLVDLVIVQAMPIVTTILICLFTSNKSQLFNSLTYTTSFGAQLAYWPLLVDMSSSLFSLLIYYGPAVSISLHLEFLMKRINILF